MNDGRGQRVEVGDTVQIWPGRVGEIVCSFEDQSFSRSYGRDEWGHLKEGVLVRLADGTLFRYEQPDEDFVIVSKRAT